MKIEHDSVVHRFVARLDEGGGELVYRVRGTGALVLVHTEVDPALRGRGVADALARAAFAYARENDLRVVPLCPYIRHWLEKHPEERDRVTR